VLLRGGNQARTFPAARRLQVLLHLLLTYLKKYLHMV
jgi:hypothetical protein